MPRKLFMTAILLFTAGAGVSGHGPTDQRGGNLDSLVAAERAFSALSAAQGIKVAFLANLASQAIVLQAKPILGRPVYEKIPPGYPAVLTWRPVVAEVSAAGDLGWTSGPYEMLPAPGYKGPPGVGRYVSVWGKQSDGTWKVLIDGGIGYPAPETAARPDVERPLPLAGNRTTLSPAERAREKRALMSRDASFSSRVEAVGYEAAHLYEANDDIRLYFDGEWPILGKDAVKAKLAGSKAQVTLAPLGAEVSASGDLAYSYGTGTIKGFASPAAETSFSYLRIWRKSGTDRWRLSLDLLRVPPSIP